jgi:hypothetical protein
VTVERLRLKAEDAEDLQVISAILQDAIVPLVDVTYRTKEKDFILIAQRFCREQKSDGKCFERIRCAVHVTGVGGVQVQKIERKAANEMLELLAVMPEGKSLHFVFAGGGKMKLKLNDWMLFLEDFGEPWPAMCEPCHEEGSASGARGSKKGKT